MTKKRVAALAGLLGLVGAGLSAVPIVLEIEEALGLAWLFRVRGPIDPPDEVAIVSLSGESAEALGVSYHVDDWPRRLHAEVVDRLAEAGAAVIVFDIMFIAPRPDDLEGDARLASAIARAGNVVLAERVVEKRRANAIGEERRLPIEPLRRAALATAPFMLPLVPVRVSQSWTFGRAADTPSLPSVALHAYALSVHDRLLDMLAAARPELAERLMGLRADVARENGLDEVMRRLRSIFRNDPGLAGELREQLDGAEAPLLGALIALYAGDDSRYLNYYGPARTIPTVPYHEVLVMDTRALREAFSGRAVFIGFSESRASEQQDEFVAVYADRSGQRLAGVEIGATLFANLLRLEAIRPTPLPVHLAVVAAWGIVAAAIGLLLRGFAAIAVGAAAGVAFAAAAQYVFEAHGLWTPLAIPLGLQLPLALLVGLSLSHGVLRRQRERVRSALGYYVPASVVDRLAKESLEPHANREVVFGTCLVTDAEQYTTLSESLHPSELVELMDAYYEALVDVVHRHGGVVSDIGGDSMIA
ncbi:MAG TPA: CHASE2 domain-containing protein, partial [Sandaracinaceae bacterium]